MKSDKRVLLLHGFSKTKRDMHALKNHLEQLGYACVNLNLPLTFHPLEAAVNRVERWFRNNQDPGPVHLVGHSTGGLVIRKFLSETGQLERIGRCVLVATPNNGSKLADLAWRHARWIPRICRTLGAIRSDAVNVLPRHAAIELGAIAGSDGRRSLMGKLLSPTHDGRVEADSVYYEELADYRILPYSHTAIHYRAETAAAIDHFLREGRFGSADYPYKLDVH